MRIIDENGVEIAEYDPALGRLVEKEIVRKHHPAVDAVEEQGHYEVIAEYENGGKDVKWIVDVEEVEAREAYDEMETVLLFIPYTAAEKAAMRIEELKQKLSKTDYKILKIVEGAATLADCAATIKERAEWRREINELEGVASGNTD